MRAARRLRRLVLTTLALVCVFVMAAGTIVAHLLPLRLDRWDVPLVRPQAPAAIQSPLAPAAVGSGHGSAAGATPAGVGSVLAPLLSAATLGSHVGMLVTSLATGQVLYSSNAAAGFAPASTTKIATAVAALSVLAPAAQFRTEVVAGPSPASIVLVGGGDPTLAAGTPPASRLPASRDAGAARGADGAGAAGRGTSHVTRRVRRLAVRRAGAGPRLAGQLRDHRQRDAHQLAGGRPGAADARRAPRRTPTTRRTGAPGRSRPRWSRPGPSRGSCAPTASA